MAWLCRPLHGLQSRVHAPKVGPVLAADQHPVRGIGPAVPRLPVDEEQELRVVAATVLEAGAVAATASEVGPAVARSGT